MAKPLVVRFNGCEIPLGLQKVERSDLYGYVEVEVYDEDGNRCTTASLAQDGQTIMTTGCTAIGTMSYDGRWLDRSMLAAVDLDGKPIEPVTSTFNAPVELDLDCCATIEELLNHSISTVYELSPEDGSDVLLSELRKGKIFTFPFSYRGGLYADTGFMLMAADGTPFFLVGKPTQVEFIGLAQPEGLLLDEEDIPEEEDSLDFAML